MPKLTPWFPAHVKPTRKGVYFVKFRNSEGYAYWHGRNWGWASDTPSDALGDTKLTQGAFQQKMWRGLAEQPK